MFRIIKKYVSEKIRFLTFPKKVMGVIKVDIFWAWKKFQHKNVEYSEIRPDSERLNR